MLCDSAFKVTQGMMGEKVNSMKLIDYIIIESVDSISRDDPDVTYM